MQTETQKYIYNKSVDLWFIKFPILFPIIYFSLLYMFPSYENYLIIATIILLAEPHFGATWSIFLINQIINIIIIQIYLYRFICSSVFFNFRIFYFQNLFFIILWF